MKREISDQTACTYADVQADWSNCCVHILMHILSLCDSIIYFRCKRPCGHNLRGLDEESERQQQ